MSVLIKGMEMPKNCAYCTMLEGDRDDGLCHAASRWLDDEEYWLWYQYPEGDIDTSKPINCPLVPVPTPHGELIDRVSLSKQLGVSDKCTDCVFQRGAFCEKSSDFVKACEAIYDAPTVIEAEV